MNSAQILHMFNKNIISMQKLRNKKLDIKYEESTNDPEKYIKEVIDPFSHLIKKKQLQIIYKNEVKQKKLQLITDWKLY